MENVYCIVFGTAVRKKRFSDKLYKYESTDQLRSGFEPASVF
jgi:hypothetical protein